MVICSVWLYRCSLTVLQWRNIERDGVWNHTRLDCMVNRFLKRRSKKTSNLRVTGLCDGNPPVTDGYPTKGQ